MKFGFSAKKNDQNFIHPAMIFSTYCLEVVLKRQIMFESKASCELKTERTRKYVSISIRGTTQLSDIRWGFKTTSNHLNDRL